MNTGKLQSLCVLVAIAGLAALQSHAGNTERAAAQSTEHHSQWALTGDKQQTTITAGNTCTPHGAVNEKYLHYTKQGVNKAIGNRVRHDSGKGKAESDRRRNLTKRGGARSLHLMTR